MPPTVHQVLQIEQGAAARGEPAQQLPAATLPLVGVAEEHMAVAQRHRGVR